MPHTTPRFVGRLLVCLLAMVALALPATTLAQGWSHAEAASWAAPAKKKKSSKDKKTSSTVAEATDASEASAADEDDAPSVPPPSAGDGSLQVVLPVTFKGKLSGSSRETLTARLQTALAAASAEGGPYRVKASLSASKKKNKKRNYTITLTVLGSDDATLVEVSDTCRGCKIGAASEKIDVLVVKMATQLAALAPADGEVTINSVPAGAMITVDGKEIGPAPQTLKLAPGEHSVEVAQSGYEPLSRTVTVEEGGKLSMDLALAKVSAAAAPADTGRKKKKDKKKKDDEPKKQKKAKKKKEKEKKSKEERAAEKANRGPRKGKAWTIAGGAVLGAGVIGVVTGVAMLLIDENNIPSKCKGDDVDFRGVCRYRYNTTLGGALGIAGGALGIGGGIALMVQGRRVTVRGWSDGKQATVRLGVRF